jgi:hypothetical protein
MVVLKRRVRKCKCGQSRGKYESDGWHAWVEGDPIVIGLNNNDLLRAIYGVSEDNSIEAWVFDKNAERVEWR